MMQQSGWNSQVCDKTKPTEAIGDDWKWSNMFQHSLQAAGVCLKAAQLSMSPGLYKLVQWGG